MLIDQPRRRSIGAGMTARHWIGLTLCAALAAPVSALAEDAMVPPPLELVYDMTVGGVSVMHFDLIEHDSGDRYRIDFSAQTDGVANWVFRRTVTSSSEGALDHGRLSPSLYLGDTTGGTVRHSRVDFQPGGGLTYRVSPDPAQDPDGKLTPIEPKTLTGTTDPLAGLVALAEAASSPDGYDGTVRIFDGRHRYDLVLRRLGNGRVESAAYTGPATECSLHLVRLGGYAVDTTKYITKDDATMWIATVAEGVPPVPVEIVFEGHWGTFHAHLTTVKSAAGTLGVATR
jgi:hypothetical protein